MTLPSFTDGETLYSWSAKTRLAFGWSARRCSSELFGSLRAGNGYSLPVGIPHLVKRSKGVVGTAEELAAKRTILAGHLPWMSAKRGAAVLEAVCRSRILQARGLLGTRSDRSVELGPPRFCIECCKQDKRNLGYARWLVEHQLPGYWVCRTHQVGLSVPTVRLAMSLPSDALFAQQPLEVRLTPSRLSVAMRYSAHALQMAGQSPVATDAVRAAVVNQLMARGVISNPARLSADRLHRDFLASETADLLRCVCPVEWWQNRSWVSRSLKTASDLSPLKWLTLWIWAFENFDGDHSRRLLQTCAGSGQSLEGGLQLALWPAACNDALPEPHLERVRIAMADAKNLEDLQKRLGVGHGVLARWLSIHPSLREQWRQLRLQAKRSSALARLSDRLNADQDTRWADLTKGAIAQLRWLERNDMREYVRLRSNVPQERSRQQRLFGGD